MSGTITLGGKTLASHSNDTDKTTLTADEVNVGSNALVVDSSGNVGVGTSSPSNKLTIQDASNAKIRFNYSDGTEKAFCNFESSGFTFQVGTAGNDALVMKTSNTERMRIDAGGRIGINRVTAAAVAIVSQSGETYHLVFRDSGGTDKLLIENDGDIYNTNGGYYQISDIKNKENVVDANSQWDDIKNLRVVNFNFTEASGHSTHRQIGFIAQEVELVCEHCVKTQIDIDDEGNDLGTTTKSVATSIITIKAIKALQEAMERIESQQSQIDALTARIEALEAGN